MSEGQRRSESPRAGVPGEGQAALLALATGGWRQAALTVAARLDLAAMLGARAADLEEVCYSLGTSRQATHLFLAACEGLGLVVERDDEYRLGPVGHALRRLPEGAVLTGWGAAAADVALSDALWDVLHQPRLGEAPPTPGGPAPGRAAVSALGLPYGEAPPADEARARAAVQALHGAAAAALAAALPLPVSGLVLESGGQGVYARALLGSNDRARAVILDAAPWALGPADGEPAGASATGAGGPPGTTTRQRLLSTLDALGGERATLGVLAQPARTLPLGALRARLGHLASYLAEDATVAVVGPFRGGAGRPLAPLLALLELAAGGAGWCLSSGQATDAVRAAGFSVTQTLLLPEPDVAIVAHRE
jgi:hypothetical protein